MYFDFSYEYRRNNEELPLPFRFVQQYPYSKIVSILEKYNDPAKLKPDQLPQTGYFLLSENKRIIGAAHLRHRLTPNLEKHGGHISYSIRPSERRKGYGTALLGLLLVEAETLHIRKLLIMCAADNHASIKVVETNGGQYEGQSFNPAMGKQILRYRIRVAANAPP